CIHAQVKANHNDLVTRFKLGIFRLFHNTQGIDPRRMGILTSHTTIAVCRQSIFVIEGGIVNPNQNVMFRQIRNILLNYFLIEKAGAFFDHAESSESLHISPPSAESYL